MKRTHEEAALMWERRGDHELAALERRNADLERWAAELERDKAALFQRRDSTD